MFLNGMKSYTYCYDKFLKAKGLKTEQATKRHTMAMNPIIEEHSVLSESFIEEDVH